MSTTGFATLFPGTNQVGLQSDGEKVNLLQMNANSEISMDTSDSCRVHPIGPRSDGENVNPFLQGSSPTMDVPDSDIVNPPAPYVADMSVCQERLKTFEEWPKFMKPTALDLAKAGFYYTGMGDRVMCFSCKVVVKNWAPSDTAWGEHARWRPSCNYLKMAYCKPKSVFATPYRDYDTCDSKWTVGVGF